MRKNFQAGFTLIELMVSLTLFVIVVLAAVSSLYSVNNASRKVSSMRTVLDNLSFAVENISRTIRTGTDIVCAGTTNGSYSLSSGHNCRFGIDTPSDRLSLHSTIGKVRDIEYRLSTNVAIPGAGQVERRTNESGTWGNWVALTAPEINVQKLSFYVQGADIGDSLQPSVMMIIEGVAVANAEDITPFTIQTYISQRAAE